VVLGYNEETEEEEYSAEVPKPLDGIFDNSACYQLSDAQFSVVSVVAAGGPLDIAAPPYAWPHKNGSTIETTEYEPYGRNRRIDRVDFNLDGGHTIDDLFQSIAAYFANASAADANDDGVLQIDDLYQWINLYYYDLALHPDAVVGWARTAGGSGGGVDNPYGYCGYFADMETLGINGAGNGFLYHVRHRVYDPIAGRWLQRDPAGFVDGMNLYEYCGGGSVSCFDPMGLFGWSDVQDWARDSMDGLREISDSWTEGTVSDVVHRVGDGVVELVSPDTEIGRTTRRAAVTAVVGAATAGVAAGVMGTAYAGTVTGGAIIGGVSAGLSNAVDQRMQINDGDRDDFSVKEVVYNATIGAIAGGVFNKIVIYLKGKLPKSTSPSTPAKEMTPLRKGDSWTTARRNHWITRANNAAEGEFSPENMVRMRNGKPPLHDELGVPKELDHIIPRRSGGKHTPDNLREVWPWEHDAIDPYRHYRGPRPPGC
jgi:RHS repeat-associated protein